MRTRSVLASLLCTGVVIVGCSSGKVVTVGTSVDNSSATSTADTSTVPATSDTVAATSTLPGPQGWAPVDLQGEVGPLAYPCCGSNWSGTPSPPLPTNGEPLADGGYVVTLTWADDPTQPLVGEVHRLEQCSVLPDGVCQSTGTGPGQYFDDEMGIDPDSSMPIELALDGSLRVVLLGFAGFDQPAAAEGNGADLAQLAAALDEDYRAAILAPLAAGVPKDDIVTGLWASGEHHFGMPNYDREPAPSELVYTNFGAPPLLFQAAFGFDDTPADNRGTDVMGLISIGVQGGRITLHVYAGWYS